VHKVTSSIAAIGLVGSLNAYALGVGDITTNSALNQVLNAKIALTSSTKENLTNLHVKLASREVFRNAGIEKSGYLFDLKFEPRVNKEGQISINVSSENPIKEPFVNFILEVEWPKGRTLKEFTILLDPPITMQDIRPTPVAVTSPLPEAQQPQVSSAYTKPVTEQKKKYGPVKRNTTIWSIAKNLTSNDQSITHEQMMIALYDNNPKAFYKKNINALKRGAILRVPSTAEVNQRTADQANAEYVKQNALWSSSTRTKAVKSSIPNVVVTPKKDNQKKEASKTAIEPSKATKQQAKLTLLAPESLNPNNDADNNSAGSVSDTKNSNNQANLAVEMATTLEQENKEVQSRLTDLEEQVNQLQRLLTLKDKQLAQLQSAKKQTPAKPKNTAATKNDNNNWFYVSGAILIALLALFLGRRKKGRDDDSFEVLETNLDSNTTTEDTPAETPLDESIEDEVTITSDSTLLSEFTPSEFANTEGTSEADPLTECDVYIAYGRFQQAEDLIQRAIEDAPDNLLYKQKLLDVHFSASNGEAFEDAANQLIDLKETDPQSWAQIAQMGAELLPNSALFSSAEEEPSDNPEESEEETTEDSEDKEDEFEFDFDLIEPENSPTDTTPSQEGESEVEFDLDSFESDSQDENSQETKLSLAEAYIEMEDFDSAKEILNEVLATGSEAHIQKAQSLLEDIK